MDAIVSIGIGLVCGFILAWAQRKAQRSAGLSEVVTTTTSGLLAAGLLVALAPAAVRASMLAGMLGMYLVGRLTVFRVLPDAEQD